MWVICLFVCLCIKTTDARRCFCADGKSQRRKRNGNVGGEFGLHMMSLF